MTVDVDWIAFRVRAVREHMPPAFARLTVEHPDVEAWCAGTSSGLPGGLVLTGTVGCLTGDTVVQVHRQGRGYKLSLAELVARWEQGPHSRGRVSRIPAQRYGLDDKTFVRGLKMDGTIGLVRLVGVLNSGVKHVVELTLSDGRSVKLTPAHEIMTPGGKVPAESLRVGAHVLVDSWRGRPAHWGENRQRVRATAGSRLPDGRWADRDGYVIRRGTRRDPAWMYEHRYVMEMALGRELSTDEHVHHLNHVRTDNRIENLQIVSHRAHATYHADRKNMPGALAETVTVVSVRDAGREAVYDLSVDDDAHTWIGNGVIVGNTGKTGNAWACWPHLIALGWVGTFRATTEQAYLDAYLPGGDRQSAAEAERADVLLLDDVGAAKVSDWSRSRLLALLDARWTHGLPTVVTSNLPTQQLAAHLGDRAVSRLGQSLAVVTLTGPDRRMT